jgi:hypothetical protein
MMFYTAGENNLGQTEEEYAANNTLHHQKTNFFDMCCA